MERINFQFVYPVTRAVRSAATGTVKLEPVALLNIKGYGTVNNFHTSSNKDSCVSFRITSILLGDQDIASFLPALDQCDAITQACIDHLFDAAQQKQPRQVIDSARIFRLPVHSRAK